jgi:hypothetical protein
MTYRELREFTEKHPNPCWNKAQHDRDFEFRYNSWVQQQNSIEPVKKETNIQKSKKGK